MRRPPGPRDVAAARRIYAMRRFWHDPVFLHCDRVPTDTTRLLFVGNHSLFAAETPLLWLHLAEHHDIILRPLGDRFLFKSPLTRRWFESMGAVEGSRENCAALMEQDQPILVFPGGAREALHERGKAHQLLWGDRAGFAVMAARYDYTIVPFGVVGIDDQWDYVRDRAEMSQTKFVQALRRWGVIDRDDIVPPIIRGIGPTPIPRPNRHYYAFGEPVPSAEVNADDEAAVWQLRETVRTSIEALIAELLEVRRNDPEGDARVRLSDRILGLLDRGQRA